MTLRRVGAIGVMLATLAAPVGVAAETRKPQGLIFSTVSLVSEHRYEGASGSNRKPTLEASIYLWRPDKTYAGVFTSGVDYGYVGSPSVEVDLYAGRRFEMGQTRLSLQAMYALFPDRSGPGPTYDFFQVTAKAQRRVGKATVSGWLDVTPQGSYRSGQGWRVTAEAAYPLTAHLTLSGRAAHSERHRGPPRNSWDVGVTVKRGPVGLDLRYSGTDLKRSQCYGTDWCEPAVVAKLSYDLPSVGR